MPLWTRDEAVHATQGTSSQEWSASGISIDTRTLEPGDLFVALSDQRDGHDFVKNAFARGAAAALVSHVPDGLEADTPLLLVKDVQKALENLGQAARARSQAKIIAITGSVGKTSTKEMLRVMLSEQGTTHASVASYNNHWGVPLTLARMPSDSEFGIFEIGMNHPGEIAPLTRQVAPHVALVTTVSAAHLEAFENIEGIAQEKASIMEGLVSGGKVVLNADLMTSDVLQRTAENLGHSPLWFGKTATDARLLEVSLTEDMVEARASLLGEMISFRLNSLGSHFAMNALGALSAASAAGADTTKSINALATWQPPKGRGGRHLIEAPFGRFELIDDAYNANPASMEAALDVLALSQAKRRIAILGDMRELGKEASAIHGDLANLKAIDKVDVVHTVGPHMCALRARLNETQRGIHAHNAADLLPLLDELFCVGDCVLVKASLGTGLGVIVNAILQLGRLHES